MFSKSTLFALLFACFGVVAQETKSFTLFEAQDYAVNNAEKIKNAEFDLQIAEQKVKETRAIGLPQIKASGRFSNFLQLPVQVVDASFINPNAPAGSTVQFKAGTDYNVNGTLDASQLIFDGSYIVGLQVSKFYTEFVATSIEQSRQDVLFNVTQAYQMALIAKENLVFIDSLVTITEELVNKQKNYFEVGLMTQEDLNQLYFSLSSAKTSSAQAKNQYNTALNLLKMTMAYPIEEEISLTEDLNGLLDKNYSLKAISGDLTNNTTMLLLNQQKALSEYSLKNTKYAHLPSLGAFFQQQYNAYRNNDLKPFEGQYFPTTVWGLQLNVPIFSSGMRYSKMKQAEIEVLKAENKIKEFKRAITFQEISAKNNFTSARETFELQKSNVALAKSIYDNAVTKKQIGEGNSIMVSQKYAQLVTSQAQYIGSMLEVFNTRLELDKLYNKLGKK